MNDFNFAVQTVYLDCNHEVAIQAHGYYITFEGALNKYNEVIESNLDSDMLTQIVIDMPKATLGEIK